MPKNAVALAFATGLLFAAAPGASPIALAAGPSVKDIITNYGNVAEAMYSELARQGEGSRKSCRRVPGSPERVNIASGA